MKWCAWLVLWPAVFAAATASEIVDEEANGGQPELYIPLNGLLRLVSGSRQMKRDPFGINARGFHEDIFNRDYGSFNPMRKRSLPEQELHPQRAKRSVLEPGHIAKPAKIEWSKRRPEMDSSGFHGDTFSNGFGDFWTMRKKSYPSYQADKRRPEMDSAGFYGDTFTNGFGDFYTLRKKSPHARPPPKDFDYDWPPK